MEKIKVLMISSDRNIFSETSAVSERMKEYGALVGELHIVLLSDTSHKLEPAQIGQNVWIYPTHSLTSILRPIDAVKVGKRIVFEKGFIRGRSLITAQDMESGWAGVIIKKKWRIPLEIQIHNDPFSLHFSGFQNIVRKFFAHWILKNADSIRVVGEGLKQHLSRYKSKPVNVLPIYIDRDCMENQEVSFNLHDRFGWRFILLVVARLTEEKNIGLAIKALSIVAKKFPTTGMVIVGSGREMGSLKRLANRLNLKKNISFVGWQENLFSFYKTSNAFIQTSKYEGYGMALIEAGIFGIPILTTKVGVAKELVHDRDAFVYDTKHPEKFAEGIFNLIQNNQKRHELIENMNKFLNDNLINKEEYLKRLKSNWENTALAVK